MATVPSVAGDLYDYMWIDVEGSMAAAIWTDLREGEDAPAIYLRTATAS